MTRWGWIGLALLVPACGGARAYTGGDAKLPEIGLAPLVETDVQAGYARYAEVLARWGEWEQDDAYGVRWCPTPVEGAGETAFVPFHNRGHWVAAGQPMYGAPGGTPYWSSDDAETWGEITMHHGWWVREAADGPKHESWCWVPGAEETPARVVWRTGDGFVGWAAEPPSWIDDGDEGLYADFEWSFCFVGGLLEDELEGQYLTGDVQARAAEATSRARLVGFHTFDRHGPPVHAVHVAREAIVQWVQQHPEIGSSTALKDAATARVHAQPSVGAPAAADHGTKKRAPDDDRLPNAMAMAPVMMTTPLPYGPLPRFVRVEPGAPSGWASAGAEAGPSPVAMGSPVANVSRAGGWTALHGASSTWHASVMRSGGGGTIAHASSGSSGGGWHSSGSSSSSGQSGWHSSSGGHPASSHHGHGH